MMPKLIFRCFPFLSRLIFFIFDPGWERFSFVRKYKSNFKSFQFFDYAQGIFGGVLECVNILKNIYDFSFSIDFEIDVKI